MSKLPIRAPEKNDNIIIIYLKEMIPDCLSFVKIKFAKLVDALRKFPVHIVVAYGLPFKLLKPFACNEHTNDINIITQLL